MSATTPASSWLSRLGALLLGTLLVLALAEAGLRVAGLFFDVSGLRSEGEVVILCEGDSFTYGIGGRSYPEQLEQVLDAAAGTDRYQAVNEGIPGLNTALLADRLEPHLRLYRPDVLVVVAGENNSWNSIRLTDPEGVAGWTLAADKLLLNSRVYKFIKVATIGWRHARFADAVESRADAIEQQALHMLESDEDVGLGLQAEALREKAGEGEAQGRPERLELAQAQERGDYEACIARGLELQAAFPDDPWFLLDTSSCYLRLGRLEEALTALRTAMTMGTPDQLRGVYHQLGATLVRMDLVDDAIAVWRRGLEDDPTSLRLFHAIATHRTLQGDLWQTLKDVDPVEGIDDNKLYVYLRRLYEQHASDPVQQLVLEHMRRDVRRIIELADRYGVPVLWTSYPHHGYPVVKEEVEAAGGTYIDFVPLFAERFERREDYLSADNCHCNDAGYRLMAEVMAVEVRRVLDEG